MRQNSKQLLVHLFINKYFGPHLSKKCSEITVGDVGARVVLPQINVFSKKKKEKNVIASLAAICASRGAVDSTNSAIFCLLLFLLLNYKNSGHLSKLRTYGNPKTESVTKFSDRMVVRSHVGGHQSKDYFSVVVPFMAPTHCAKLPTISAGSSDEDVKKMMRI